MKNIVLFLVLVSSVAAQARMIDIKTVRRAKDQIQPLLMAAEGVNGVGISNCEPGTNLSPISNRDSKDLCISVNFVSEADLVNFRTVFPDKVRINGVALRRNVVGNIGPQ